MRSIAAEIGRAPSTISREIKRNGGQECYRASHADQSAWDRGRRPKTCKLARFAARLQVVGRRPRAQADWSAWLSREHRRPPLRLTSRLIVEHAAPSCP